MCQSSTRQPKEIRRLSKWWINTDGTEYISVADSINSVCQGFVSSPIRTLVTEAKGPGRIYRGKKWSDSFRPIRFIALYFQPKSLAQETMISEMLRTSRWYNEEPVWPPGKHDRNSWFKKRTLYSETIEAVRENPGISMGEVARKLGRSYHYISPLLFHLRNFGSLRYEPVGRERIDGLEAFSRGALRLADALQAGQREDQGALAQEAFKVPGVVDGEGILRERGGAPRGLQGRDHRGQVQAHRPHAGVTQQLQGAPQLQRLHGHHNPWLLPEEQGGAPQGEGRLRQAGGDREGV